MSSDTNRPDPSEEEMMAANGNQPDDPGSDPMMDLGEDGTLSPAALEAAFQALADERDSYKDRYMRTFAEMENIRKRAEREKADIRKYAISDFARDVLGLGDNIQRAIAAVPAEAAAQDGNLKAFLEGVQLLERELLQVLERHGVTRIDPQGQRFDPHQHQAVMEMDRPDLPAGSVAEVFQSGYVIGERVLRPAMVAVAKGGARLPKEPGPEAVPQVESTGGEPPADEGSGP